MAAASAEGSSYVDTRSVLHGRDMLCFGHDWGGDPLSKTHLMRLLARDNRILWINSIGYRAPTASKRDFGRVLDKLRAAQRPVEEVEENLFVLNPLAIPAYGVPLVQRANRALLGMQVRRAMFELGFSRVVNWVFNPTAAVVAGALGEDMVVYYCVDDFTAFAGVPTELAALERTLLARADLVVVSSDALLQKKSKDSSRVKLVRHGVAFDHFQKALAAETQVPAEVARLPRPILGYFGLMAPDWIDVDLLMRVAERFSSGSLVLLGRVTMDLSRLTALPNVHLLGRKPFAMLPAYCKGFDVALNPFPLSEVTRSSNPLKVREYLAAGLPVVSTRIPEVERLAEVRVADSVEEFFGAIERALFKPGPNAARSECMRGESWEAKLDEVRRAVASVARDASRNGVVAA
jgi:glycosyltransferase involved in cell wall biosynthesis